MVHTITQHPVVFEAHLGISRLLPEASSRQACDAYTLEYLNMQTTKPLSDGVISMPKTQNTCGMQKPKTQGAQVRFNVASTWVESIDPHLDPRAHPRSLSHCYQPSLSLHYCPDVCILSPTVPQRKQSSVVMMARRLSMLKAAIMLT